MDRSIKQGKTLIADYDKGGLKLIDLDTKRKAIRIKTVKKNIYMVR